VKREDLTVGQEVILRNMNERYLNKDKEFPRGKISAIGRKLVMITQPYGDPRQYRIEEQVSNDQYQHAYFQTLEQYEAQQQRTRDIETLQQHGLGLSSVRIPGEKLHAVADFLRGLS
jgi:hypothetical protein